MTDPVFHKTEQGQDEIRTRAYKLRALQLIVNGERRRSALLAQTAGMGVGPEGIEALLDAGLIRTEPDPELAVPGALPANPLPAAAGGTYRQLYHFYTDVIGQHLGLRGYLLQVKVEKAGNSAELAALRDPLYTALHKAKGEITAGAIIDQLDRMVRMGDTLPAEAEANYYRQLSNTAPHRSGLGRMYRTFRKPISKNDRVGKWDKK